MSKYEVDTLRPRGMNECDTIGEALREDRVVEVTKEEDGRFRVEECCDRYFAAILTKEQLIAWADELRELANS